MVESGDQGEGEGDQTKPQSPHERSPGSDPGLEWASPPISAEDFLRDPFTLAGELLAGDIRQAPGRTLPVADDPPMDSTSNSDLCIRAATQSLGLRRSLEGLVQSSVDRTTRYRQQGHQIEGHRIHRLTIGDTRVFRGVQREQRPNTAIHLLVDRSPSMSALVNTPQGASARRIDLAWEATIALAMALEAIPGVNPGITAFPGDQGESTRVHRILPHGGRLRQVMGRINTDLDGSTPLAEALLYGASVLFGTSESRKVLLVLTDGIPDDLEAAQSVLQDIREAGIEVHGLGLAIDVSSVFGDSVQIANVSELSGRLFDLCRKILIHAH